LPSWAKTVLSDKEAAKYVSGVGVHWYWNNISPVSNLDKTHNQFPDVFLLATEATTMGSPKLGSWEAGEKYAVDIVTDLLHWMTGWIDWNFSLDLQGGPSWVANWCDAPIIVNSTGKEYYKQPMYYALGHFSKFIPSGSVRIGIEVKHDRWILSRIHAGSFVRPDGKVVTVVING